MSTPFPGMDPYLERRGLWEGVPTELYDRAGYDLAINYSQPAVPPLVDTDADWAASLLTEHLAAIPSGSQQ